MAHRKVLMVLAKISGRIKIVFQKDSLDHVTPDLSFSNFSFLSAYRKNLLCVALKAQSVQAPSAYRAQLALRQPLCYFLSRSFLHAPSCHRTFAHVTSSN